MGNGYNQRGDNRNLLQLVRTMELVMAIIRDLITGAYLERDVDGKRRPQGISDMRTGIET